MRIEPGKIYQVNQYFWLLFPTKEGAARAEGDVARATTRGETASWASYWSKELNCNVAFLNEEDIVLVVEVSDAQVKVINQEGRGGWVNLPIGEDWIENTFAGGMTGNGT